ncbi:MAG: lamin tail domain-containing protein [Parcubacteria group bacterium]|jgi:hypothetical protein
MEGNKRKALFALGALVATAIGIFCYAKPTRAADSGLIITEVMYNPGGTNKGYEWVEVYNSAPAKISIPKNSLGIIDEPEERDPDGKLKNTCHTFDAELAIDPGEFIIITDNKINFQSTHQHYTGKILDSVVELLDSGDTIKLSFDRCSTWEAELTFSSSWGTNGNGRTLEKINLTEADTEENWQESCDIGGTPGEASKECERTSPPSKITYSKNLKISELLPNPSDDEGTGEFTEIYNADPQEITELSDWKLEDKTGNSYPLPDISINPDEYHSFYRNNSSFSLNNTGGETIFLKNPDGEIVDQISYSESAEEDCSFALSAGQFFWTSVLTPNKENVIKAPESDGKKAANAKTGETYQSAENVYLNEILPNPKDGSDGEYIEIANGDTEPVDLFGWKIKDTSKSKGYQFKDHITINPGEYLAIYRPDFKIALNNSDESVYLYNPKNEITSSVSFAKSIENSSYNFDGKEWKWSKFLTPGKKNKFDSLPKVKIKKIKYAYKDLYAEFSVKAEDKETKNLKYIWNFGDGKKSTLAKTTHKYLATGKYIVTLSVSDDSQTVEKSFSLEVKKFPRPDLEIVKIVPNPAGSDAEAETIDLKNNSNKKIDLTGWKIATGSGEKIFNHPISSEFILGPNETKAVTREFSKFSLNNNAGKVQLVMPDGKVADSVEYSKEKIIEDEAYAKINGEWKWFDPNAQEEEILTEESSGEDGAGDGEVLGAMDENPLTAAQYDTHFTSEDAYIFLSQISFMRDRQEINYTPASNPSSNIAYLIASLI